MRRFILLTLISTIILSAFLIPKSFDNGVELTGEKKEKVEELVRDIKTVHFNDLQRAIEMNYKVQNVSWDNKNQCYQINVSFYTLFNIRYTEVKANCKEYVTI